MPGGPILSRPHRYHLFNPINLGVIDPKNPNPSPDISKNPCGRCASTGSIRAPNPLAHHRRSSSSPVAAGAPSIRRGISVQPRIAPIAAGLGAVTSAPTAIPAANPGGSFNASRASGWVINTAFVERLNLSLRQRVAAIRRRSATSCKGEDGLSYQLALFQVYYNFVLPHASLRQALAQPIATNVTGSAKVWQPCTPAMAAGLTEHVWSLKEVLFYRVPPWPQTQTI